MPTRDRLLARAAAEQIIDLQQAAQRANYASETLRKMMFDRPEEARPPLFKNRSGRWVARVGELDAWIARLDQAAKAS